MGIVEGFGEESGDGVWLGDWHSTTFTRARGQGAILVWSCLKRVGLLAVQDDLLRLLRLPDGPPPVALPSEKLGTLDEDKRKVYEKAHREAMLRQEFQGLPASTVMRMLLADQLQKPLEHQIEIVVRQVRRPKASVSEPGLNSRNRVR